MAGNEADPLIQSWGENLRGERHRHRWSVPFRGHLLCADDYCGDVRTVFGAELTEDEREQIRAELRAEYGYG